MTVQASIVAQRPSLLRSRDDLAGACIRPTARPPRQPHSTQTSQLVHYLRLHLRLQTNAHSSSAMRTVSAHDPPGTAWLSQAVASARLAALFEPSPRAHDHGRVQEAPRRPGCDSAQPAQQSLRHRSAPPAPLPQAPPPTALPFPSIPTSRTRARTHHPRPSAVGRGAAGRLPTPHQASPLLHAGIAAAAAPMPRARTQHLQGGPPRVLTRPHLPGTAHHPGRLICRLPMPLPCAQGVLLDRTAAARRAGGIQPRACQDRGATQTARRRCEARGCARRRRRASRRRGRPVRSSRMQGACGEALVGTR